jgi:hypothetical protein
MWAFENFERHGLIHFHPPEHGMWDFVRMKGQCPRKILMSAACGLSGNFSKEGPKLTMGFGTMVQGGMGFQFRKGKTLYISTSGEHGTWAFKKFERSNSDG